MSSLRTGKLPSSQSIADSGCNCSFPQRSTSRLLSFSALFYSLGPSPHQSNAQGSDAGGPGQKLRQGENPWCPPPLKNAKCTPPCPGPMHAFFLTFSSPIVSKMAFLIISSGNMLKQGVVCALHTSCGGAFPCHLCGNVPMCSEGLHTHATRKHASGEARRHNPQGWCAKK